MYVCTYINIVYMHIYIFIYKYINTHTRTHPHPHPHTLSYIYILIYIHNIYIYTYIFIYSHHRLVHSNRTRPTSLGGNEKSSRGNRKELTIASRWARLLSFLKTGGGSELPAIAVDTGVVIAYCSRAQKPILAFGEHFFYLAEADTFLYL
ncbi:hypothetical protein CLU79DRAFT_297054 [Phycomyces nitens]|nr:hypothetical protein CLU79DRAFT_297054 [Phycomyces nitens]